MKTVGWGNGGAVEIQGLTASKSLPQLPQDELLWCVWYCCETPPKTDAGSSNEPGGFEVGVEWGGAGVD